MNFELEDKLNKYVKQNDLETAIRIAEAELSEIPKTDFHQLIGMNLLHMESALQSYISNFYASVKTKYTLSLRKRLKAFYCEINGFTINYDRWFIDLFSYSIIGQDDYNWLADYDHFTKYHLNITGLESLQEAYKDVYENKKYGIPHIGQAYEVAELLIILRLQELFKNTYENAKSNGAKWANFPIFVTAHDYEIIYRTK